LPSCSTRPWPASALSSHTRSGHLNYSGAESHGMTKNDIIDEIMAKLPPDPHDGKGDYDDEPDYRESVLATLRDRLPDDVDIRTCSDFRNLGEQCCEPCHAYPHYDMYLVDLPSGGQAWICCAVRRSLR
jgi:hypothetical protein